MADGFLCDLFSHVIEFKAQDIGMYIEYYSQRRFLEGVTYPRNNQVDGPITLYESTWNYASW